MSSSDKTECIICFEELSDYSVAILSCGHKFHLHCIQGWKNTQGKSSNFTRLCCYCRDTNVEIINIIDGNKRDPKVKLPKGSSKSSLGSIGSLSSEGSTVEPARAHIYERRRQSVNTLSFVNYDTHHDEGFFCCCRIL